MPRTIDSSFKQWLRGHIEETGELMVNAILPQFDTIELYNALVPNRITFEILTRAGRYLQPEFNHMETPYITTQFSDGTMEIQYALSFMDVNTTTFNHILLPYDIDTLTTDSELGQKIIPVAMIAREWSTLYHVVDEMMVNIATDPRSLGGVFPWVKTLIQGSEWAQDKRLFHRHYGLTTKKDQDSCDASFEGALGIPFNVPPLRAELKQAALSGTKLLSQARMLLSSPNYKDQRRARRDITSMKPIISRSNVPTIILAAIKDTKHFHDKGYSQEMKDNA